MVHFISLPFYAWFKMRSSMYCQSFCTTANKDSFSKITSIKSLHKLSFLAWVYLISFFTPCMIYSHVLNQEQSLSSSSINMINPLITIITESRDLLSTLNSLCRISTRVFTAQMKFSSVEKPFLAFFKKCKRHTLSIRKGASSGLCMCGLGGSFRVKEEQNEFPSSIISARLLSKIVR